MIEKGISCPFGCKFKPVFRCVRSEISLRQECRVLCCTFFSLMGSIRI